jgi:NAD(P)-dependent dehydrogenase (short-subunit alcohol dehydrogenase family)
MLLEGKNAVVYGGGGSVGGAVARAFAREGADVFLAGRTREPLDRVASDIEGAGGQAEVAELDALDGRAVGKHMDDLVDGAGSVDVSFNAISIRDVQLIPLAEMSQEDFMSPIVTGMTTHFVTAKAAAGHMAARGSGVILTFTASAARAYSPDAHVGGFGIACNAIEALTKQLAAELGPRGIRAVCLRSEGIPESWQGVSTEDWSGSTNEIEASLKERSLLGRVTALADVGNAAAFLASDRAAATTGTVFNLTSGTVVE